MTTWDWIGLAICAGLAVYLFAALLRPELFDSLALECEDRTIRENDIKIDTFLRMPLTSSSMDLCGRQKTLGEEVMCKPLEILSTQ